MEVGTRNLWVGTKWDTCGAELKVLKGCHDWYSDILGTCYFLTCTISTVLYNLNVYCILIYIYMFLYMIFSIYTIWNCVSNLIHAILETNVIIWILLPSPTNFDLKNCLNVVIETQVALLRSVLQSAVRVPVPEGKRWTQHLMIWLFGDMFRGDEMCL